MRIKLVMLLLMITLSSPAFSADRYTVANGATVTIDEHGVCQKVTNSSTSRMVPTKSAAEWSSFRSSPGAGVSLAACPPPCGGTMVGGYCWYATISETYQSCDDICASRGGCNLEGTRNYAGSGGTDANCQAVLNALGVLVGNPFISGDVVFGPIGCHANKFSSYYGQPSSSDNRVRQTSTGYTAPTDCETTWTFERACACNN